MYVYEVEYKNWYTGYTEYMYIVAPTDYEVSNWLRENTKHDIVKIEKLGLCETIISHE